MWNYRAIERAYEKALSKLEEWEEIEKERYLEKWEEEEKREAERDANYYGALLEEEEEANRQQICESQGLARWC